MRRCDGAGCDGANVRTFALADARRTLGTIAASHRSISFMRWLSQTVAVAALSVRTIPQRLSSSAVAVVGIAGVVIVFVAVLSIGEGFRAAMSNAGSPSRAVVLRGGADSEMTSGFGGDQATIMTEAPGLKRVDNRALASPELYVMVDVNKR